MRGQFVSYVSGSNPRRKLDQSYFNRTSSGGNVGRWFKRVILKPLTGAVEDAARSMVSLGSKKGLEYAIKKGTEYLPRILSSMTGSGTGGKPVDPFKRGVRKLASGDKMPRTDDPHFDKLQLENNQPIHNPYTLPDGYYGAGMAKLNPSSQKQMMAAMAKLNKTLGL